MRFAILLPLALGPLVQAVLPIHTKGDRFIRPSSPKNEADDNTVFFVEGIDYQPGGSSAYNPDSSSDVLSDSEQCARDAFVFQQLGINTIRVYSLNPDVNHDECMTILNNAGIYVILDVNTGADGENLNRADPSGTYNSNYMTHVFKFIDAFKNYPNVLGFFSGNEVINDDSNYAEIDPQYIRAVQRDMKQYIAKHSNRSIPVGYSAADNSNLNLASIKYLECNSLDGSTISTELDESRSEFFGLNTYQWCSGSTWDSSGYSVLNSTFSNSSIPLIFSEYGCNAKSPRTFEEVPDGLYGGLVNTFSGGLVYEYSQEANKYGLVELDSDGSIKYLEDFENLQSQFTNLTLPNITEANVESVSVVKCDSSAIQDAYSNFGVKNFTLPTQPDSISSLIRYGVNGTNTGKILTSYDAPTTFNYTIENVSGSEISAVLTYADSNTVNELYTSASGSATAASSTTTNKASSQSTTSDGSSSSSTSKSKGLANHNIHLSTGFCGLVMGLLSALL